VRESIELIAKAGATPCGVTIALDRQEKATLKGEECPESAVQQVEQHYQLPVVSIASLADLLQYLSHQSDPALVSFHPAVAAYRQRYGV
jgi:orotate phosphoribosyltransferase